MVAIKNIEDECGHNPKTLGDWVKNFRVKKIQMKRRLRSGGNLRVCAILSSALMTAEFELRRKQQERFQKWLDFQTKIDENRELHPNRSELHHHLQRHQRSEGELALVSNHHSEEMVCKQSEEISKLWKCELSDLDNFMRSISSCSKKNQTQNDKELDHSYQTHLMRVSI